jgi:hypothetical protein
LLASALVMQKLGVAELIDERVDLGDRAGAANSGAKALTVVGAALAGGGLIDDVDVLRSGAMPISTRLRRWRAAWPTLPSPCPSSVSTNLPGPCCVASPRSWRPVWAMMAILATSVTGRQACRCGRADRRAAARRQKFVRRVGQADR